MDIHAELAAIDTASFDELKARYPEDWQAVGTELLAAVKARKAEGAAAFVTAARDGAVPWRKRLAAGGRNARVARDARPHLIRERLAILAVQRTVQGALATIVNPSQQGERPARFTRWNGTLVQALLFARGLERKPVSLAWFRLLWPLVSQKALLMPLVEPKGIYCFYARPLIVALAALVEGPVAIEIAAGDGTLSRFLRAAGAQVKATDDHSWARAITFPADVERLDAVAALHRHQPTTVFCSWPPPGNAFERAVFECASVQRYVVLTTRHTFAAGAWDAYKAQTTFTQREDPSLSRLILPPEIDPLVLIFDRK